MAGYPIEILTRIGRIEVRAREEIEVLRKIAPALELCMAARAHFGEGSRYYLNVLIDATAWFTFDVEKVSDIAPVLRWFAKRGHRLAMGGHSFDSPETQTRGWRLRGGIIVSAQFVRDGSDSACRYVKTGERPRSPEPIYKLVCPEGIASADLSPEELAEFSREEGEAVG